MATRALNRSNSRAPPISLVNFKLQVGEDLLIDPHHLKPIRELAESETWIVEEAFWDKGVQGGAQKSPLSKPSAHSGEKVIVKSFRPNWVVTKEQMQQVIEETRRLKALEHERIVKTLGIGCYYIDSPIDIRSSLFLVERFAGTWTVFKMLRSRKLHPAHPHVQFDQHDLMRWCVNIAEGLVYLHSKDIVHRDLKNENIFLTDEGDVHECTAFIGDIKPHREWFRKPMGPGPHSKGSMGLILQRQATLSKHAEIEGARKLLLSPEGSGQLTDGAVSNHMMSAKKDGTTRFFKNGVKGREPTEYRKSGSGLHEGGDETDVKFMKQCSLMRQHSGDNWLFDAGSRPSAASIALEKVQVELAKQADESSHGKKKKKVHFSQQAPEGWADSFHYSLIYMAPEYCEHNSVKELTKKSDVFSFSKVMYEILTCTLINPAATDEEEGGWHITSAGLERYCRRVAQGYREPIPDKWSASLNALVTQCWHKDPNMRPSMTFVLSQLKKLSEDRETMDALAPPPDMFPEAVPEGSYLSQSWDDDDDDDEDGTPKEAESSGMVGSMLGGLAPVLKKVSLSRDSASKKELKRDSRDLSRKSPTPKDSSARPSVGKVSPGETGAPLNSTSVGSAAPNMARQSPSLAKVSASRKGQDVTAPGCNCIVS